MGRGKTGVPDIVRGAHAWASRLARHYRRSPEQISAREVQDYLLFLHQQHGLSWSTCNTIRHGVRFFFRITLGLPDPHFYVPGAKEPSTLPQILNHDELVRLFTVTTNLKHRAVLMTAYAAGLRASELGRLQVSDIDSDRMCLRIDQGRARDTGGGKLAAAQAEVTRLRLGLEGSRPLRFEGGAELIPSVEIGVRHDGGDAETGFGADIGGGLAWSDPQRGLSAEVRGRGLLSGLSMSVPEPRPSRASKPRRPARPARSSARRCSSQRLCPARAWKQAACKSSRDVDSSSAKESTANYACSKSRSRSKVPIPRDGSDPLSDQNWQSRTRSQAQQACTPLRPRSWCAGSSRHPQPGKPQCGHLRRNRFAKPQTESSNTTSETDGRGG